MDNPQTLAKLGPRHRKKTDKIKNTTQKTQHKTSPKNTFILEIEQNIGILQKVILELPYHETCFNRIAEFTVVWHMSVNDVLFVYTCKRFVVLV